MGLRRWPQTVLAPTLQLKHKELGKNAHTAALNYYSLRQEILATIRRKPKVGTYFSGFGDQCSQARQAEAVGEIQIRVTIRRLVSAQFSENPMGEI